MTWARTYGHLVTGQPTPVPAAARVQAAPDVESITVGKLCVVVIFQGGAHRKHLAGSPEYAQYADMARGMGKGRVLAGRDGAMAYGNVDRLVGKWKG